MAATKLAPLPLTPPDETQTFLTKKPGGSGWSKVPDMLRTDPPPAAIDFCGEAVPLDRPEVQSRWQHILRSHGRRADALLTIRRRAATIFPVIDPILKKYGIPADFRYMVVAESELEQKAVSRAGAAGYWQFMPQTARSMGLKVGRVDERYNLRKATDAACRYLKQLYTRLGSWSLVAAAYNAGPGHVQSRIKAQRHQDYFSLRLFSETSWYLYRILFYKEVMNQPLLYASVLPQTALASLTVPLPGMPAAARPVETRDEDESVLATIENLDMKPMRARVAGLFGSSGEEEKPADGSSGGLQKLVSRLGGWLRRSPEGSPGPVAPLK